MSDTVVAQSDQPGGPVTGQISKIKEGFLLGWLYDSRTPGESVRFRVRTNGEIIPEVFKANRFRQELADKGLGDGNHGFRLPLNSDDLFVGKNKIEILNIHGDVLLKKFVPVEAEDMAGPGLPTALNPTAAPVMAPSKAAEPAVEAENAEEDLYEDAEGSGDVETLPEADTTLTSLDTDAPDVMDTGADEGPLALAETDPVGDAEAVVEVEWDDETDEALNHDPDDIAPDPEDEPVSDNDDSGDAGAADIEEPEGIAEDTVEDALVQDEDIDLDSADSDAEDVESGELDFPEDDVEEDSASDRPEPDELDAGEDMPIEAGEADLDPEEIDSSIADDTVDDDAEEDMPDDLISDPVEAGLDDEDADPEPEDDDIDALDVEDSDEATVEPSIPETVDDEVGYDIAEDDLPEDELNDPLDGEATIEDMSSDSDDESGDTGDVEDADSFDDIADEADMPDDAPAPSLASAPAAAGLGDLAALKAENAALTASLNTRFEEIARLTRLMELRERSGAAVAAPATPAAADSICVLIKGQLNDAQAAQVHRLVHGAQQKARVGLYCDTPALIADSRPMEKMAADPNLEFHRRAPRLGQALCLVIEASPSLTLRALEPERVLLKADGSIIYDAEAAPAGLPVTFSTPQLSRHVSDLTAIPLAQSLVIARAETPGWKQMAPKPYWYRTAPAVGGMGRLILLGAKWSEQDMADLAALAGEVGRTPFWAKAAAPEALTPAALAVVEPLKVENRATATSAETFVADLLAQAQAARSGDFLDVCVRIGV